MIKSYSQRDKLWAEEKLGSSSLTIGKAGCVTTCIADLSTFYGDSLNPLEISKLVQYTQAGYPQGEGLIIWSSCVFPHFRFERREYGRNEKNIRNALKHADRSVILQVANKSHWVVAIRSTKPLGIADPWNGGFSTMKRYGDNITGAAYFIRI